MLKKDNWLRFVLELLLIIVCGCAIVFVTIAFPTDIAKIIISVLGIVAVLYFDDSSITSQIRNPIPKSSLFYRKKRKNIDEITERYKTATFLCLLVRFATSFAGWLTMGLGILLPILAVIRYVKHSNQIKFSSEDKKSLSTTVTILLLPGATLLLWGIDNHKYPLHFWILWIVISLAIIIPFFLYSEEYKRNDKVTLGFCACILLYVFGAICTINFQYDYSEPVEYRSIVSDKYESSGKSTSYYLVVEHGQDTVDDTFSVSAHTYIKTDIGDSVTVGKKQGFLRFEWYYLNVK